MARLRPGLRVRILDQGSGARGYELLDDSGATRVRLHRANPALTAMMGALSGSGLPAADWHRMQHSLAVLDRAALIAVEAPGLCELIPWRAPGLGITELPAVPRAGWTLHPDSYLRPAGPNLLLAAPFTAAEARLRGRAGRRWLDWLAGFGEPAEPNWMLLAQLLTSCGLLQAAGSQAPDPWLGWEWADRLLHDAARGRRGFRPWGGTYKNRALGLDLPDAREHHPGPTLDLSALEPSPSQPLPFAPANPGTTSFTSVVRARRSIRQFAPEPPGRAQLGALLDLSWRQIERRPGDIEGSHRAAPSGGGLAAMEIYPVVCAERADGLADGGDLPAGLYHYQADTHQLVRLGPAPRLGAAPLTLIITHRHRRVAAKYQGIAYSLALQNLGVLYQSIWLAATAVGLGGYPLGSVDAPALEELLGLRGGAEVAIGRFELGIPNTASSA